MIKFILLNLLILLFLYAGAWFHHGSPPALWGLEEKIIKMIEFPDTAKYRLTEGLYLDAGYKFTQYHIFQIPVWNNTGEWTGYIGKSEHFLKLSHQQLQDLAEQDNLSLPEKINLPFWDEAGGKMIILSVCLLFGTPALVMIKKRYQ